MRTPLLSPESLAARLGEPELVVLEVSFFEVPRADYATSHIPGARFSYWKDLLWHETQREFATSQVLADRLGPLGVGDDSTLVLVGDPLQFATYTYWVLTMAGLAEHAYVLDGGRRTWTARHLPTTSDVPPNAPQGLSAGQADHSSRIGRDEVREGLGRPERVLLDLRSLEEFTGQRVAPLSAPFDHGAERRGHIPGARHLPVERLLRDEGTFAGADELRGAFEDVGALDAGEVVTTCRLGHRASLGWFALTQLLGREHVRVYDGSWTEWGSIVGFPIEN